MVFISYKAIIPFLPYWEDDNDGDRELFCLLRFILLFSGGRFLRYFFLLKIMN